MVSDVGFLGKQPPPLPKRKMNTAARSESLASQVSTAPPLPPMRTPIPPARHQAGSTDLDNSTLSTGEQQKSLSLADFVRNYSNSLPVRVVVKEGFCGNDERYEVAAVFSS